VKDEHMEGDSDEEEDKYDNKDRDEVIKVNTTNSRAQRAG